MTVALTFIPSEFSVATVGISRPIFTSKRRYLRVATGGLIGVSGGRTWSVGVSLTNGGEPWVGFRFNMGALAVPINFVSTTVAGSGTQTQIPAAVNPVVVTCKI
jgi:hypothetical protein